jgi:HEAT repeat protein
MIRLTLLLCVLFSSAIYSKVSSVESILKKTLLSKSDISNLKVLIKDDPKKNVPVLFSVMKDDKMPEQSRWLATILIGKTLGKRSIDYLAKYTVHPEVILRLASLKSLLSLEAEKKADIFEKALFDKSLLVRKQALEAVRKLKIEKAESSLLSMLVDKKNYYLKNKKLKRSPIIKDIIQTIGELRLKKSKNILISLRKKDSYQDLYPVLDFAISRM